MLRIVTAFCALLIVGCATSIPSRSETSVGASFDGVSSFAFVSSGTLIGSSPDFPRLDTKGLDRSIRSAISSELRGKGLSQTSASQADILIGYGVSGQPETDSWYDIYVGPRGGVRNAYYYERDYVKGTLIIDAFEPRSRELMWRGWASKDLYRPLGDNRDALIGDAVSSILSDFPPR